MVGGRVPGVVGVKGLRTKRVRDTMGKEEIREMVPAGYTTVTI